MVKDSAIDQFSCEIVDNIVTPINADLLEELLIDAKFDTEKRSKLVDGFKNGFDLGYRRSHQHCNTSKNILFRVGVGDEKDMW